MLQHRKTDLFGDLSVHLPATYLDRLKPYSSPISNRLGNSEEGSGLTANQIGNFKEGLARVANQIGNSKGGEGPQGQTNS